jgi:hypothetical protein
MVNDKHRRFEMPIFKDFSENGELLQTRDEPLNTDNLKRYIKENGIEKAQGYFEALQDMIKQFENCIIKERYDTPAGESLLYYSPVIIKKNIDALLDERKAFHDTHEKHIKPS